MLRVERAAGLTTLLLLFSCVPCLASRSIPLDSGPWRLWCDTKAEWKDDKLYLPGEFKLAELPVNPPTIGWDRLYRSGIEVALPSTVEEHFWGKFGRREYSEDEYYFAKDDKEVRNGNYLGVSWWWTRFRAPEDIAGRLAFIEFDGVRLRAEVFLNEQLVGYDLIGETPFTVDVTGKLKPGEENALAVRITNPGGRLDWADGGTIQWGQHRVPISHGFGGINRGVRLEIKPPVYVASVFVMNRPDPRKITVRCELANATAATASARLGVSISDTRARGAVSVEIPPGVKTVDVEMDVPEARLWSVESPNLYACKTTLRCGDWVDTRETTFGFRFLDCAGIGENARFLWNGKRIVLRSAISWGFWGINGLWPDEEMAGREVLNAKAIGLNCLNFHRCIGKPPTLDTQDRLGLLRYEEPGSGGEILSKDPFAAKYMQHKIARMVKRDRNHPSLAMYCVQNEMGIDENDPVEPVLRMMHDLDPTRPAVFKSGIATEGEAYFLPYEDKMRRDDGTGYSGWWDAHTVGGPMVYQDNLYEGPEKWSHRSDNKKEIVFWGEMLGAGIPDNLQPVYDFYRKTGRSGFDRQDNAEQYRAFEELLDRRGFRKAFPTVGDLTRSIGNRQYYFWGRMLENGRISDNNDCMVISGWESTSIENHSGIVDSHRYTKGDPKFVSYYCRPLHLAIKSRHLVIETGESLVTDLHIVNEVGVSGPAEVDFSVVGPGGRSLHTRTIPVRITGGEVYGELLAAGIETKCYDKPGYYTLRAILRQDGKKLVEGREDVFVVDNTPPAIKAKGAIMDYAGRAKSFLASRGLALPDYFHDLPKLDYIIAAGESAAGVHGNTQRTDGPIGNTTDPTLYRTQVEGDDQDFWVVITDIPNGRYQVTLKFAELTIENPGERVFDLAINDKTVLKCLDVLKETGGRFRALDKTVEADVTDHKMRIWSPRIERGWAILNAFLISGEDVKVGVNCQGPAYTDASGFRWSGNWEADTLRSDMVRRVKEDGTTLIFWTAGPDSIAETVEEMGRREILKYEGRVDRGSTSWMGCWTAVREHPLLKGLPVNTAVNWEYQMTGSGGFIVDGPGVEWISAYGRDHSRKIGTSLFTVPYGKGQIIVNCLEDPYGVLAGGKEGLPPAVARRMLFNAIEYAAGRAES